MLSPPYWIFAENFPKAGRIGKSFLVLLGCPSGRYYLGTTLPTRPTGCMHKCQNCFEILWDHQKKIPFFENYKECAICVILRENTPFCLAAPEAKTCCAMLRRGPKIINANHGYQEKMFIAWKVCDFVGKVEMSLYRKNHFGL